MNDWYNSSVPQVDRTVVEARIMEHIESVRVANNLPDVEKTYDHIIQNWYMFDHVWLRMVTHMKDTGRLK